jgi:hypothetical protein
MYLLPTAAFFRSDLHSKKRVTRIAIPHKIIDPNIYVNESYPPTVPAVTYLDSRDGVRRSMVYRSSRSLPSRTHRVWAID